MNDTSAASSWRHLVIPTLVPGCAYGSSYPSLIVNLEGRALSSRQREDLAQWLDESLSHTLPLPSLSVSESGVDDWRETVSLLLWALHCLQVSAGLTVFEESRIMMTGPNKARCQISTHPAAIAALRSAVEWLYDSFGHWSDNSIRQKQAVSLVSVLAELGKYAYRSPNTARFVRAALGMGVPVLEMPPGEIIAYGQGRRGRWLDSSVSDRTPYIGARLSGNKQLTGQYLQQAGLPTAEKRFVRKEAEAVEAAEAIGYPAVVKPLDQNSGRGVAPDLHTRDEVLHFFALARQYSDNILIEKHVTGRDYRMVIFNGQLMWTVERIPGGVTGNGQHTVMELLEQLNSDPRRGSTAEFTLKTISLDDEALLMLKREQLTPDSVPEQGRFVRLRRTSNVSLGGMPVAVNDQVHPDNRVLAERAARALRLDIAGVDLLIDDISQSWRDIGAAICEVNSHPDIGQITTAGLYAPMMRELLPGNGRVPVVLVLGAPAQSNLVEVLSRALSGRLGMVVGYHDRQGAWLNGQLISSGPVTAYEAGRLLTLEPAVDAMVISIDDLDVSWTGLPMARHDLLVIAGSEIETQGRASSQSAITALMSALLPGCDGQVLTLREARMEIRAPDGLTQAHWLQEPVPAAQLVDSVVDIVTAADERHNQTLSLPDELQPGTERH